MSTHAASQGIGVALWELANRVAQHDSGAVTERIEAVTKAVFDSIETAWATFEGFNVPIPEVPVEPVIEKNEPPAVDAGRLLADIANQIENDRLVVEKTNEEIARINRPEERI